MAGMRTLSLLLVFETLIAIIIANSHGLMNGFWAFAGMMVATAIITGIINYQMTVEALDMTRMRVASWVIYLILAGIMSNVFTTGYGFPLVGSIALGFIIASIIWWTYYQLEPANG
ncbi:MAG: hypothetical protein HOE92_07295 [Euryarchaeota archaeon]|jgi:hypothetical protein|nr:hypothetical protein [Euryarchaeota archaeon]MBT3972006.1 hypothetical protein [Euryarchaeota archaeon]MBT4407530.1 hypothetical protein [Euryarchaeota archaeon]MBT6645551.1 hypothetical protein [Euryarchaeota archaeon]